jgi:hypothetical protein|tara:strand:- start:358 stop:525 length:168 start_codon:yes stop_codon:yes gene_type:complete
MKEFICDITIKISGNNIDAKNKEEYLKILKKGFEEDYNMTLEDEEISNIKEIKRL